MPSTRGAPLGVTAGDVQLAPDSGAVMTRLARAAPARPLLPIRYARELFPPDGHHGLALRLLDPGRPAGMHPPAPEESDDFRGMRLALHIGPRPGRG